MPTTPTQIHIAELDFDQILQNLITFMKADPTFSDYNFSGSGLNLIARVLAYVTFYNNYYLASAVNESFLDTAQLRSSVVSHGRMLGYQSHGMLSATISANVTAVMTTNTAESVTLPKNTRFELQSNTSFTFYNTEDTTLTQNTANTFIYEAPNVVLVEGRPGSYQFTVDLNNPTQRFIIPNANVDFGHVTVSVKDSASAQTSVVFTAAQDLVTVSNTDPIYILQEAYNGYPEFKFGNDIVGRALQQGNVITVEYYISRGEEGNDIRGPFRINDSTIAGLSRGVTATPDANTSPSTGGSSAEDIEQIRTLAPLAYAAQNRCVTAEDYRSLILGSYGDAIASINVFGGEDGDPSDPQERPSFGRVFIAIKPSNGLRLADTTRADILERVVKPHSVLGVLPEIIDPEYIYLIISTRVLYDPSATSLRRADMATLIQNAILSYTSSAIEKFDSSFRYSRLARAIDSADDSITSSLTSIELQHRLFPVLDAVNTVVIKYGTPIYKNGTESAILKSTSHRFDYTAANGVSFTDCWLSESNGAVSVMNTELAYNHTFTASLKNGKVVDSVVYTLEAGESLTDTQIKNTILDLYKRNPGTVVSSAPTITTIEREVVVRADAGTLDITTGVLTLSAFVPTAIEDDATDIWINVIPAQSDLSPQLNRLYTVDADTISVEIADDTTTFSTTQFFQGGLLR